MKDQDYTRGRVYLVGAGPGDPELMTLKAVRLLSEADVVLYDRLLAPEILDGVDAELIDVGKTAGRHKLSQEEINALLVKEAEAGKTVVRLKGGDPYVFGRGGEEALELLRHGIPFETVPGVTSAVAAPELAGIPVTHRGVSTSFTVVTGHEEPGKDNPLDWDVLARLGGTLVVLMGVSRLEKNVAALIAGGRDPKTPAAMVERGGWPDQRLVAGTLCDIVKLAREAEVKPPAILVVGEVVDLARRLGRRKIAFFRPENLVKESVARAEAWGFQALAAPSISLEPLPLPENLAERIRAAECVVFTSSNGVTLTHRDPGVVEALRFTKVAAIGPKTAGALEERGVPVSYMPREFSSAGLVDLLGESCQKVLLLRSAQGSPVLLKGLRDAGLDVEDIPLYEIRGSADPRLDEVIRRCADVDVFAFTSATTARYLVQRAEELGLDKELRDSLASATVAVIGPPTAAELDRLGIEVDVMPEKFTFEALLEAAFRAMKPLDEETIEEKTVEEETVGDGVKGRFS